MDGGVHPFRLLPRYRKLLRSGAEGEAVVLEIITATATTVIPPSRTRMKLGIKFPDGTTAEFEREEMNDDLDGRGSFGGPRVGDRLPVRYDPDDHGHIELDLPKLRAAKQGREAAGRTAQQQQEQRLMDGL